MSLMTSHSAKWEGMSLPMRQRGGKEPTRPPKIAFRCSYAGNGMMLFGLLGSALGDVVFPISCPTAMLSLLFFLPIFLRAWGG